MATHDVFHSRKAAYVFSRLVSSAIVAKAFRFFLPLCILNNITIYTMKYPSNLAGSLGHLEVFESFVGIWVIWVICVTWVVWIASIGHFGLVLFINRGRP